MKKSLLVLPAVLLLLAACTPEAGGGGGGGNTSTSGGGGGASGVKSAITLTPESLLGFTGEAIVYGDSTEDKVVGGMSFGYVQIGDYLTDGVANGLQWRNKNDVASQLFNTSIEEKQTIESLVFNYSVHMYETQTYAPTGQLEVMAGTTSQKDVATGAGTVFATQMGVYSYTVNLPAGTKYFKVLKAIVDSKNNSVYLASVVVNIVTAP